MGRGDYLGLGSRFGSGPSELLVATGFSTETRQASYLHYWLGIADLAHILALRDSGMLLADPAGSCWPRCSICSARMPPTAATTRRTETRTTAASTCCGPSSGMMPAGCRWAVPGGRPAG